MAHLAAAPPAPPTVVNPPATYVEKYTVLPDALSGEYAAFLTPFGPESPDTPADLRDRVFAAGDTVPRVFVYATTGVGDIPCIRVIHRPTRYAGTLGAVTAWDNQRFAFASDVSTGNQITLIHWPETAFARTPNVFVPTQADLDNQWTASAGADCVGPFAAGAPNVEEVRARFLCPVPPAYVARVLSRGEFTIRQFGTDVIAQVAADGRQATCRVLLDWYRVTSTYRPGGAAGNPPEPPATCLPTADIVAPLADQPLRAAIWTWLQADLPALSNQQGSLGQHMLSAVNLLVRPSAGGPSP